MSWGMGEEISLLSLGFMMMTGGLGFTWMRNAESQVDFLCDLGIWIECFLPTNRRLRQCCFMVSTTCIRARCLLISLLLFVSQGRVLSSTTHWAKGEWDLKVDVGDVICVTFAQDDGAIWGGYLNNRRCRHGGGYLVRREDVIRIPTRAQRPDLEFINDVTPIFSCGESCVVFFLSYPTILLRSLSARALVTARIKHDHDLDYIAGDILAIIAEDKDNIPCLGILSDASRRKPGRYRLSASHMLQHPVPTPAERPDLDFLDYWVPILFYGEKPPN